MLYNYDFLIASICIIICILINFNNEKKSEVLNGRLFILIMILAVFDIALDIASSILLEMSLPSLYPVTMAVLTLFFMCQVLMPYALLAYTYSLLKEVDRKHIMKRLTMYAIPMLAMLGLVLVNVKTGSIFYFNSLGKYTRGDLYPLPYASAIFFGFLVLATGIVHFKELTIKRFIILVEYFGIEIACVAIQSVHSRQLVTGFGIGLGILIFALTFNNPQSYTDSLTKVYDMRYFMEWYRYATHSDKKSHLLVVELHRLRGVNDLYGTAFGDDYVIHTAEILMKQTESVFRTGNRFFLAFDNETECQKAFVELNKMSNTGIQVRGTEVSFNPIICVIYNATDYNDYDYLMSYVDYLVNKIGKNANLSTVISNEATRVGFENEREIARFIQIAIKDNLFEVYFQPIYSFENKSYCTMEALSRLKHPTLGFISPDLFITIAERNGLIADIGLIQLRKCCDFLVENPEIRNQIDSIKFNLSPVEILKLGHFEALLAILEEYNLPTSSFEFEITETVATEYSKSMIKFIDKCKEHNIRLSLDDFGSGYANLNTVLRLPFTTIKLDKSLLDSVTEDENVATFYQHIVSLLKTLNYKIVAEGVETKQELELLKSWHVDMIQGYYFSKPLNTKDILIEINKEK